MLGWLKKRIASKARESVVIDGAGARRQLSDGGLEQICWADVRRIEVITTDQGPFSEDVFWLLDAGEHGCVVPGEFGQQVLDQIGEFPALNYEAVIQAMGSTGNARFLVWERSE